MRILQQMDRCCAL